jgi:hypothetical protein
MDISSESGIPEGGFTSYVRSVNDSSRIELKEPEWASSAFVIGGILLVLAGILNMMSRIDITLNLMVSILLVIAGYGLLRKKDWGPSMGMVSTMVAIPFSLIELLLFYFVFPSLIEEWTVLGITAHELVVLGAVFILPMDIFCVVGFFLSRKLKYRSRLSREEIGALGVSQGIKGQSWGNCPVCGYNELEFVNGVKYRCGRCGLLY